MTKIVLICFLISCALSLSAQEKPLRIGVVGLTHSHVHGILGRKKIGDIEIVGIAEPNRDLAQRYAAQYGFPVSIVYNSMEEMIAATKPEAVAAFGSIFEHLHVVEVAAPKGIHVMVEKPLAVNMQHASKIAELAKKHNIQVLTNFETTWYPTNHKAYEMVRANTIGEITQIIVRDGHRGPKKINVNPEFFEWLTDPVKNGGGAITDFGCYGANLATWLENGKRPITVTAITQQLQPENNPKVDDEATIIITYPKSKATIQASWNWPIGRKDMEVYGLTGALFADNRTNLRLRIAEGYDGFKEESFSLKEREDPLNDPFSFFTAVIRKRITMQPYDLSSLENNLIVVEILDAARESARTGKSVKLKQ